MATCGECSAPLEPTWKYCIRCGTRVIPAAIRDEPPVNTTFSPLAIFALILACLLSPLAVVLGHLAAFQIRRNGGRGIVMAWVATGLGYLWLAAWVVGIVLLVNSLNG